MNRIATLRRRIAVAALLFGAAGDTLLRVGPWGLNAAFWIGALLVAGALLDARLRSAPRNWTQKALLGVALIFALAFAWRDSAALKLLSGGMVLVSVALASGAAQGAYTLARVRLARCFAAGLDLMQSIALVPGGAFASAAARMRAREEAQPRPALAVLRGLALAAPLLLVFGVLFASADPIFKRLVDHVFDFDLPRVLSHALLALVCAAVAGALLVDLLLGPPRSSGFTGRLSSPLVGPVEVNTVMLSIDGLFLAFIAVQLPWFFGGHERILEGAGLTYAEYARRGFFELVLVAGMAFALLLALDNLLQACSGRLKTLFRLLSHVLVLLTGIVIASALHRMNLYREVYGLTELRLYVTVFILWLAFAFAWLSFTLLRGRADRLAPGMLLSGFASALILIAINPDALVVRTNVARASAGAPFDVPYAASLSADAVPALVESLPALHDAERRCLTERLQLRWTDASFADPRAWSLGRHRARLSLHAAGLLM